MTQQEPRHISATEARVHFGALLDAVKAGETVIVERNERESVAFVPMHVYQQIKARREQRRALAEMLKQLDDRESAAQSEEARADGR